MSFSLCSSTAITAKAGAGVNVDAATSLSLLQQFSDEAEGEINLNSRFDWVTNVNSLFAGASGALSQACSDIAGAKLVAWDMSGYVGLGYAEDLINFLSNNADSTLKLLNEDAHRQFTIDGSTGVE